MTSGVIIAWNEQQHLPQAISSLKALTDEIVVVIDEATTDKSAQVAKSLGCRVLTHPHTGYVEPIRSFAISKARGNWIILLDADEQIPSPLATELKRLISQDSVDFIRLPRKNLIFGTWITSDHWWPDYAYRVFKKEALTWEDKIHSVPFTRGKGYDLPATEDIALIHHNYSGITDYLEQLNRYTDHQAQHLLADGYNFLWSDLITKPFGEFLTQYFARHGYTQGLHGLALALLQAMSECVLYLKMWQHTSFPTQTVTPTQVTAQLKKLWPDYTWWLSQSHIETSNFFTGLWWRLRRKLGL